MTLLKTNLFFLVPHSAGWEASYAACNRNKAIEIEDREALCIAICQVLAALPENQRVRSFHALALPALDCFEKMISVADSAMLAGNNQEEIGSILGRVADEIRIFTAMARTFADACFANDSPTENGHNAASARHVAIPTPLLVITRKVWPSILHVAATYSQNEVSGWLSHFFVCSFLFQCMPY